MTEFKDENNRGNFVVFPSLGYWEIDGKPVSPKEAQYGLHPKAKWMPTEVSRTINGGFEDDDYE